MSKIFNGIIISLGLCFALSSCSVAMAARKSGTTLERLQCCSTRGQFLACGPVVISSERLPTGELVEVYQYQKEKGSAARALMHGALDISTCGLWEVVGTPMEACIDQTHYFTIKVFYNAYDTVQRVELL